MVLVNFIVYKSRLDVLYRKKYFDIIFMTKTKLWIRIYQNAWQISDERNQMALPIILKLNLFYIKHELFPLIFVSTSVAQHQLFSTLNIHCPYES
jgi:hypothetical protein